jgi:hypothetical protein
MDVKLMVYKIEIRPIFEYASIVWLQPYNNTVLESKISKIETYSNYFTNRVVSCGIYFLQK